MRHCINCLALALTIVAFSGCEDNPAEPTVEEPPKFTAALTPSQEVPPIVNQVDANGTGTVTITLNLTKDAAGNITAATADFVVTLAGFPAGTVLTGAHIHQAAAGASSGVVWNTGLTNGELTLTNGTANFSKLAVVAPTLELPQAIINNPAGFYFNVHTQANTQGAVRNQLTRAN